MIKYKKSECLGLPATGKSWVTDNIHLPKKTKIIKIKLGIQPKKLFHTLLGFFKHIKTLNVFIRIYIANTKFIRNRQYLKRILVAYNRLGLLNSSCNQDILIDEGPMQSVWSLFYELPITESNTLLLKTLISDIQISNNIIYISNSKKTHLNRMCSRERKHHIFDNDQEIYLHSRKWMSLILVELRKKHINILFYLNS